MKESERLSHLVNLNQFEVHIKSRSTPKMTKIDSDDLYFSDYQIEDYSRELTTFTKVNLFFIKDYEIDNKSKIEIDLTLAKGYFTVHKEDYIDERDKECSDLIIRQISRSKSIVVDDIKMWRELRFSLSLSCVEDKFIIYQGKDRLGRFLNKILIIILNEKSRHYFNFGLGAMKELNIFE